MSEDEYVNADALAYVVEKLKEAGVKNPKQSDTVAAMGAAKVSKALDTIDLEHEEYGEKPGSALKDCKTVKEMAQKLFQFMESMG